MVACRSERSLDSAFKLILVMLLCENTVACLPEETFSSRFILLLHGTVSNICLVKRITRSFL